MRKLNNIKMTRRLILTGLIAIEACMALLTFLSFKPENGAVLFSGGSVGSAMRIFGPNSLLVLVLCFATTLSTFLFRKRLKFLLICFLLFFSLWFLSGRTIGVYWTGELTTGWFYISTDKFLLYDNENCSENVIECTTATNSCFFGLKFINGALEEDIFVGPELRTVLRNYFNQN